jgi:hypothetical protein
MAERIPDSKVEEAAWRSQSVTLEWIPVGVVIIMVTPQNHL